MDLFWLNLLNDTFAKFRIKSNQINFELKYFYRTSLVFSSGVLAAISLNEFSLSLSFCVFCEKVSTKPVSNFIINRVIGQLFNGINIYQLRMFVSLCVCFSFRFRRIKSGSIIAF